MSSLVRKGDGGSLGVRPFVLENVPSQETTSCAENGGCLLIPAGPPAARGGCDQSPEARSAGLGSSAKQSDEEISRRAYDKGFAQGHRDAVEIGRKEIAERLQALECVLGELSEWKQRLCVDAEAQLLDLSFSLAEEIVRHEVQCRPEVVTEILRAALELAAQNSDLKVCLHPEDLQTIQECLPDLEGRLGTRGRLELEARPGMARGGCLVESECGIVDARLEEQWQALKIRLRQTLEERRQNMAGKREE